MNNKGDSAAKDLILIGISTVFVFILSYFFNVFYFLVDVINKNPRVITYVDEIVTVLLTLSISLAIFSWRRWISLKKETFRRIKLQEELIRIANTKAETERIVNKQLSSEIELRKMM
ncbi:MAG: hypothetical protein NTZ63_03845 [Candidatus Omnitrophica bacterium]|nr:hypothetical protein [Candidatus Omnitrophota bacterium]